VPVGARLEGEATRPRYFPPKTKAGRRTISMPALLVADLKRWKLQCPQAEEDLVFPTPEGKPVCRDWLLRVAFYPALSRARLRRVTFHTLRHSCASAMIAGGAPITEVQHRLGHANPAITLQVYSHFFEHTEGTTADEMANVILNSGSSLGKLEKSGHSSRSRGCAKRWKCLINKAWRRTGPGGPTGLQNACARRSSVL
jgi:integrase